MSDEQLPRQRRPAASKRTTKPPPRTVKRDLYQEVTDKLIAAIEAGTAPWQRPWQNVAAAGLPMNGTTQRTYNGVNALLLMMTAQSEGYSDNRWYTFKQANELGAQVKKGSKSTPVYFFKMLNAKGEALEEGGAADGEQPRQIPFLTEYRVFHASQIEGIEPMAQPERSWTPLLAVQQLVERIQPDIRYGGNRAFYAPGTGRDFIQMPPEGAFPSAEAFAGTLAHELGHWTGAEHRLNGKLGTWGTEAYAAEELRAEICSALLCAELSIATPIDNHAAYVGAWLKKLREDKFEVFRAAKDARKMVDFLTGRQVQPGKTYPSEQHESVAVPALAVSSEPQPAPAATMVNTTLARARLAVEREQRIRRNGLVPVSQVLEGRLDLATPGMVGR
ncbi:ArdC family protein [Acidovorax temperans]|uniref:ArdC family protein n=1 Tax=Acidovorax temperans TaxID=80878 RepID=UPI000B22BF35|nr:ArdC-like ssDNA-binding domain-containing protein [Acidovorax temperans]